MQGSSSTGPLAVSRTARWRLLIIAQIILRSIPKYCHDFILRGWSLFAANHKPIPSATVIPPYTAHRVWPVMKLPGSTFTPCRNHTQPTATRSIPAIRRTILLFLSLFEQGRLQFSHDARCQQCFTPAADLPFHHPTSYRGIGCPRKRRTTPRRCGCGPTC